MIAEPAPAVERAAALRDLLRSCAAETERERRVPDNVMAAIRSAGLLDVVLPADFGGGEVDLATMLRVIEELSIGDGATGWVTAIAIGTSIMSGYLAGDIARDIFRPGRIAVGPVAPTGRADVCDGGFRLSGRWSFASGVQHADWIACGSLVFEDGELRKTAHGPDWRLLLVPASDAEVIDTWSVSGLRGTGSHDIAVRDAFVPAVRAMALGVDRPVQSGPLYRLPVFAFLALSIAPVPLGIARCALDAISELAQTKTPRGGSKPLREQAVFEHELARAEAELRAGRALLYETVRDVWAECLAGERIGMRGRALVRSAAVHATACAVRAVDVAYQLGGGSAIYDSSVLQRCFRDVHVATQHILLSPAGYEAVGHVLLGVEPPPFGL